MAKLQYNNRQFTITLDKEHVERMGWKKGDKLYISKHPDKALLYIEKQEHKKKK